jgi:hypothetical protein
VPSDSQVARLEHEIARFRAAHPDLERRSAADPEFAVRWDRAVRSRVATDLAAGRDPVEPTYLKLRRPAASPRPRAAERREYERAVAAYRQGLADEATALEIARLRSRAKAAVEAERRRLHDELAERRLEVLRRRADGLPLEGPGREVAFRRWVIEDDAEADLGQVRPGGQGRWLPAGGADER